jgi:membrane-associated phospholipid phosphatase
MRLAIVLILLFQFGHVKAQNLDIDWLQATNVHRNQRLDPAFSAITTYASVVSMLCPSGVFGVGFITKDSLLRRKGLYIAGSMAISAVTTLALKYSINRDRPFKTYPFIDQQTDAESPSFPSGHTSNAFATATAMAFAFPKWYVVAPAYAWAGAVGYSRMHLGVHYPSDVLVGAAVGAGSAWLGHWLNQLLFQQNRKH